MIFCKSGFKVLEIGGKKGGYLSKRDDIELIVSNIDKKEGCDVVVDAQNIPFEDESFDMVFMVACDYFIKDIDQAHSEFFRVLKNGGVLVIASYKEKTLMHLKKINKEKFNIESFVYSLEEYNQKLKNQGFLVENLFIKNNPPKNRLKRFVWNFLSEDKKIEISPWVIYRCLKK